MANKLKLNGTDYVVITKEQYDAMAKNSGGLDVITGNVTKKDLYEFMDMYQVTVHDNGDTVENGIYGVYAGFNWDAADKANPIVRLCCNRYVANVITNDRLMEYLVRENKHYWNVMMGYASHFTCGEFIDLYGEYSEFRQAWTEAGRRMLDALPDEDDEEDLSDCTDEEDALEEIPVEAILRGTK